MCFQNVYVKSGTLGQHLTPRARTQHTLRWCWVRASTLILLFIIDDHTTNKNRTAYDRRDSLVCAQHLVETLGLGLLDRMHDVESAWSMVYWCGHQSQCLTAQLYISFDRFRILCFFIRCARTTTIEHLSQRDIWERLFQYLFASKENTSAALQFDHCLWIAISAVDIFVEQKFVFGSRPTDASEFWCMKNRIFVLFTISTTSSDERCNLPVSHPLNYTVFSAFFTFLCVSFPHNATLVRSCENKIAIKI